MTHVAAQHVPYCAVELAPREAESSRGRLPTVFLPSCACKICTAQKPARLPPERNIAPPLPLTFHASVDPSPLASGHGGPIELRSLLGGALYFRSVSFREGRFGGAVRNLFPVATWDVDARLQSLLARPSTKGQT